MTDIGPSSDQLGDFLRPTGPDLIHENALAGGNNVSPSIYGSTEQYANPSNFNYIDNTGARPLSDNFYQQYLMEQPNFSNEQPNFSEHQAIPFNVPPPSKADRILGAYAITLETLMRDEESWSPKNNRIRVSQELGGSYRSFNGGTGTLRSQTHRSIPKSLRIGPPDALTGKYRSLSSPARAQSQSKKVSLTVPTPIHTAARAGTFPSNPVRTPFPFPTKSSPLATGNHATRTSTDRTPWVQRTDSVLTLSVRRPHAPNGRRVVRLIVPADMDFSAPAVGSSSSESKRTSKQNEKHFTSLDFDDMTFFLRLRHAFYDTLLGRSPTSRWWRRHGSARTLKRIIVVTVPSDKGATSEEPNILPDGAGYTRSVLSPRSPRFLARTGFSDTFSEEKLLQHFRRPAMGKARYAWVQWAHRLGGLMDEEKSYHKRGNSGTARAPVGLGNGSPRGPVGRAQQDKERDVDAVGGLEFVEGWCVWRVSLAVVLVVLASVAVLVLWVLLGPAQVNTAGQINRLSGAGARVETGFIMAVLVLLFGWTGVGLWGGLSWLLM